MTGTLNVKTTNASAAAVGLQGNGATILATGGGTISAAGTAIAFSGGTNQTATFDNFTIDNLSGDLVFADPSIATVNFNNTTANAGTNPLLYATAGSAITLNANASTLTGTIQTGAGATSNVNLTNGTTWNLTGPSTVTNLNVTNSIIVFAPPGSGSGFKTLTVKNYVGSGANIAMNVALGGSNSAGRPDHRQRRQGDRLDAADDQERRRPRRADGGHRHPARHRDQRRHDRVERLRARQHAGGRRLQVLAR